MRAVVNDIPRVPVPPGSGRHRLPRQIAEESVPFPDGGVPFPYGGLTGQEMAYHGQEMAYDGWDAAVVQELGPELAELWDTAEQPPVAGGPECAFPAGDAAFPSAGTVFPPDEAVFPSGDPPFPVGEAVFYPSQAAFHSSGTVFHDPDSGLVFQDSGTDRHPSEAGLHPSGAGLHPPEAGPHPSEPRLRAGEAEFGPDEPDGDRPPRTAGPCPAAGPEPGGWSWRRLLSAASVLMTAVIAIAVAGLGAVASYPSLRAIADGVAPSDVAALWPLLIYGPWVVATLSILRARAYRRRTLHSWAVVIFFAVVAMLLCIARVHPSPAGIAVAGLPPLTVLLCFHQFVRQLDLAITPQPAARHAQSSRGQHRHRSGG
ncbi:DUF2637 domain-containing protein [Streptomyces sp. NPDC059788]|uniref:DUF2637 domain-containing protein n=1 Tax=Streptomyces sp. NPDC059788 TaxID=3346948 RepID=UPI003659EC81